MLNLTKLADYALVLAATMAKQGQAEVWPASKLSEKSGIAEPTVAKLLKKLCRAGICEGVRGKQGGYKLSRAPESVSYLQIVEAVDGPVGLAACCSPSGCPRGGVCPAEGPLGAATEALRRSLSSSNLLSGRR